ncbi:DUF1190 domain-containing protein [Glaciecola sp. 33A]|jgi:uncharacterized protein YgiB involved in biofilm formation|uniref:DUF1190 domain-containing protein n=1 Tax=Glaciecola sp. 33A TaxID=2057807 RepID=UPI000C34AB0B|nr:DUF1190 domain-containing protein [Glaciecola sp. 33A]PKI01507.1 hypothetical protein CXF81_10900 [Glaciecola sp. 33A]
MQTNSNQKRSSNIDLSRMRKAFSLKPLALGVASVLLSACSGGKEEAVVFKNVNDCADALPTMAQKCEAAYKGALAEAAKTAPKYNSKNDCEYEFGRNQCQTYNSNGSSIFMPLMAGYMIGNMMSPRPYYQPMFTSYSRYSSYRNNWVGADGRNFGDSRRSKLSVSPSAFDKKPAITRTISRGGFGSSVRAKASWGSRSSGKGWGG